MNNMKTQKNYDKKSQEIWDLFDDKEEIECVYSSENEGKCKKCGDVMFISEEGFNCCSNTSCGNIDKEILDFGAEWRFYGADDKNSTDPTRCGNPINPLLVESSFGCKVMASSNLSYEMKKIRKWTKPT
jgi:transcription initiation factor TFIIIB Brf1 subunit/transcription initiation factor TFIIB